MSVDLTVLSLRCLLDPPKQRCVGGSWVYTCVGQGRDAGCTSGHEEHTDGVWTKPWTERAYFGSGCR